MQHASIAEHSFRERYALLACAFGIPLPRIYQNLFLEVRFSEVPLSLIMWGQKSTVQPQKTEHKNVT